MWLVPILLAVASFVLNWRLTKFLTEELTYRAEMAFAATALTLVVLGWAWRRWQQRPAGRAEAERTAWLNRDLSAAAGPADAEPVDSWQVLRAQAKPDPQE